MTSSTNNQPDPQDQGQAEGEFETKLDDIMEDLIVGHNFEYARKALIELFQSLRIKDREEAIKKYKSFCGCPMCLHHTEAYALTTERNKLQGGE